MNIYIGDSITDWNSKLVENNYGIAGDKTIDLVKRLPEIKFIKDKIIYLMIGVNDIINEVSFKEIKGNYKFIVDYLLTNKNNNKLVLLSILPTTYPLINEKIIEVNSYIKELSLEKSVDFLDIYKNFLDDNGLLNLKLRDDFVHLNKDGYEILNSFID